MNANQGRRIAVIGAGIGGLTCALAFARTGAVVTVFEQAAALTDVGAGLQITPNGARCLAALGLAETLAQVGVTAAAVCPMDALDGRQVARFDLTKQSPAYRFYHRADLLAALAAACVAAGVTIRLGTKITDGSPDGRADLTIGADGLRSLVRAQLNGAGDPFFTGQVAWRTIVPATDAAPVAQIWMAPGRHLVTYPLRDGMLNVVAVQERADWAAEGWHHADDPENLCRAFADLAPVVQDFLGQVTQTQIWGLFRHPVAENWCADGRVAILGDAAHPTLPFLAQGANLAIEDALVMAAICQKTHSLAAGLTAYQQARRPRVIRAIKAANANAVNYHLGGMKARVAHGALGVLGRFAPDLFLNRLGWLYDYDAPQEFGFKPL